MTVAPASTASSIVIGKLEVPDFRGIMKIHGLAPSDPICLTSSVVSDSDCSSPSL
jgi:hypothetical protein